MGYWIPKYIRPLDNMATELMSKVDLGADPKLPEPQRLIIYREITELHNLIEEMENLQKRVIGKEK